MYLYINSVLQLMCMVCVCVCTYLPTPPSQLPAGLSLPAHRALKKLDPVFLESRRSGLEHYLQTLVSEQVLSRCPQALPSISLFLSNEAYQRSHNELDRQVQSL